MGRLLFIIIVYSLPVVHASGQIIKGYVRDSLGEVVPFASVVATGCQDERVLAFTTSDHQGQYQLQIQTDCDSIGLTARGLGYQMVVHHLSSRSLPPQQDFVLIFSGLAIREIIIRDKPPPVIARRDTTEYDAAAFSDSTEFSVEDLLKKIPGVQVAQNGIISYNGKTVERVLLEGDDLFSTNYSIATRNLRANMVAKVQVIDRYQENQLLKGIQESDRMVMNLTIRPDKKRSLSGSITSGLGYGDEWKGKVHTNLFSLSRKDKFYLIANANNTGENAVSDIEWMNQGNPFDNSSQLLQTNPLRTQSLVQTPGFETAGLPAAYTRTNRSGLLYIGEVLPVSPNFKVKISGWMGEERLRQEVANSSRYLLNNSTLEILETRSTRRQSGTRHLQVEPEYFSVNKKHALRGFITIDGQPENNLLNIVRQQAIDTPFQIINRLEAGTSRVFGAVEYTFKKSEGLIFQVVNKNAWYRGTYLLRPNYAWYPLFFGLDNTFTQLQQDANQEQGTSLLMLRLMTRRKSIQWLLETGTDWQWGRLNSVLHLENNSGEIWKPDTTGYHNQLRLFAPKYFINGSATYIFGPLFIRPRLMLRYQPARLTAPGLSATTPSPATAAPRLDIRYSPTDRSIVTGFYNFQQEIPGLTNLYPAYLFTDYQTLERGQANLDWISGHQAGLFYRYNNRLKQFSWNIGSSWRKQDNDFGTQYQINPFLIIQEAFRPVHSTSYALNGGVDRYFHDLSMRFALHAGFNSRQERAKINSEEIRDLNTRLYLLNISCGTAFDGWVNAILDSRLNHIILSNNASLNTTYWFSTLQLIVKPASRFHLKIFLHHTANRAGKEAYRHFYAADGLALLRLPKWHSEVELTAFNILGSRRFEQISADAFLQSRTAVTAVQRFFLLSWSRNF